MNWKESVRFAVSVSILIGFLSLLAISLAFSADLLDMSSEPDINAEQNTTGVPVVNTSGVQGIDGKELEMVIFAKVNKKRKARGVEPFVHSERVRLIARLHSANMGKKGYFNHTNPEGLGSPGRHEKFDGCDAPNENIAKWPNLPTNDTNEIAERIVTGWSNSPGHNQSMLTPYDKVSGVGVYVTEDRDLYVTQNFCREHPNA